MNHISYEQFRKEFLEKCSTAFPEAAYETGFQEVKKITGSYEGIMFVQKGRQYGICVNPTELYERYEKGASVDELIAEIKVQSELPVYEEKLERITDYSSVKDRLFIRVSNAEIHQKVLADVPHKRQGEFALTVHIAMTDSDNTLGSVMITDEMLKTYGIPKEQLFEDAFASSPKLFTADVEEFCAGPDENRRMYLVTNRRRINGAAVMFYPGFLERLAGRIGSDFYVIPSSIHEMIIWPYVDSIPFAELEETLKIGNSEFVSPGEKLSEHVYYVSPEKLQLERADQRFAL